MSKHTLQVILIVLFSLLTHSFSVAEESKKQLLFVNSYHTGYKWSDDIERGLLKALNITVREDGTHDTSRSSVDIKIFRMNTKINKSENSKKQAAITAKKLIEEWQPDIVVASDDNASRYLLAPYYKNSDLPFVFCGVNWDASSYGFPTSNITGMIEVGPIHELVDLLHNYTKGHRISYIGANNPSTVKNKERLEKVLGEKFHSGKLVGNFKEWQQAYIYLQESTDMLIWLSPIGIRNWEDKKAISHIFKHTKIPTGATGDNNITYSLLGKVKIAEEQGWWSGKTALKILSGTSPSDIPVTNNKQSQLYLNMDLAKQMHIKFPMELINQAIFVGE